MLHWFFTAKLWRCDDPWDVWKWEASPSFDRGCHLWPKCLAGCLPAAWISTTETAAAGSVLAQTSSIHPHAIHTFTNCNDRSKKEKNKYNQMMLMDNLSWCSMFFQKVLSRCNMILCQAALHASSEKKVCGKRAKCWCNDRLALYDTEMTKRDSHCQITFRLYSINMYTVYCITIVCSYTRHVTFPNTKKCVHF